MTTWRYLVTGVAFLVIGFGLLALAIRLMEVMWS